MVKMAAAFMALACLCIAVPAVAADIDFNKALVIGSGPKIVVEFTDPDCPFCRKASGYFQGRKGVKRYVFFNPLPRHPMAREKARYILSQHDGAKAYHEVMSGRLDKVQKLPGITKKGTRLQEEQMEIVRKAGLNSTPTFMINGRIIVGFDLKRIEETLGK